LEAFKSGASASEASASGRHTVIKFVRRGAAYRLTGYRGLRDFSGRFSSPVEQMIGEQALEEAGGWKSFVGYGRISLEVR
jgi:hypothetical protein